QYTPLVRRMETFPLRRGRSDGKTKTSPPAGQCSDYGLSVTPEGLEPSTICLKGNCSAIELRGHSSEIIHRPTRFSTRKCPAGGGGPGTQRQRPRRTPQASSTSYSEASAT